jgi:hypothetical protein
LRALSTTGVLPQTAPPLKPGGTMPVFQRICPVVAFSASMLPRNVQQT